MPENYLVKFKTDSWLRKVETRKWILYLGNIYKPIA